MFSPVKQGGSTMIVRQIFFNYAVSIIVIIALISFGFVNIFDVFIIAHF